MKPRGAEQEARSRQDTQPARSPQSRVFSLTADGKETAEKGSHDRLDNVGTEDGILLVLRESCEAQGQVSALSLSGPAVC